jgi:predicted metal-dependent hydrolase
MSSPAASGRRTVQFGSALIVYEPDWRPRRDLAITVHPDLRVTALCPLGRSPEAVDAMVLRKAPWILRQQLRFQDLHPLPAPRRFVPGETFRYLGRQYRLKLLEGQQPRVALSRPYLRVVVPDVRNAKHVRRLIDNWMRERAAAAFAEHVETLLSRFPWLGPRPETLRLRTMSRRWGSCSASGTITLNPSLVAAHPSCIEYVVAHELCHRKVMKHNQRFYRLLERAVPDWQARRDRLNKLR